MQLCVSIIVFCSSPSSSSFSSFSFVGPSACLSSFSSCTYGVARLLALWSWEPARFHHRLALYRASPYAPPSPAATFKITRIKPSQAFAYPPFPFSFFSRGAFLQTRWRYERSDSVCCCEVLRHVFSLPCETAAVLALEAAPWHICCVLCPVSYVTSALCLRVKYATSFL